MLVPVLELGGSGLRIDYFDLPDLADNRHAAVTLSPLQRDVAGRLRSKTVPGESQVTHIPRTRNLVFDLGDIIEAREQRRDAAHLDQAFGPERRIADDLHRELDRRAFGGAKPRVGFLLDGFFP